MIMVILEVLLPGILALCAFSAAVYAKASGRKRYERRANALMGCLQRQHLES